MRISRFLYLMIAVFKQDYPLQYGAYVNWCQYLVALYLFHLTWILFLTLLLYFLFLLIIDSCYLNLFTLQIHNFYISILRLVLYLLIHTYSVLLIDLNSLVINACALPVSLLTICFLGFILSELNLVDSFLL